MVIPLGALNPWDARTVYASFEVISDKKRLITDP